MRRAHLPVFALLLGLAACGGKDEEAEVSEPAAAPIEKPARDKQAAPSGTPANETSAVAPEKLPANGKVIPLTPEGWGVLKIGMTRDEITAAMGPDSEPGLAGGPDPAACDQYHPENAPTDMLVMLENDVVTRISVMQDSNVVSEWNIGIGAEAAKVKAAYPDADISPHKYQDAPAEYITAWSANGPSGDESYTDDPAARGIRYEIGDDGKVMAIHAGGPSIQYVEGCL
ncbi:hypothetical protein [Parvularcula marina]|uniref:Uncharacterized protein n=1 Tax=Parvularcula marina TaxID=2292771 RepID=A0A371RHP1_9PROT|nr:hypothetical protein [Parvularcula marina]RFB04952.1 hypothetical protein DX908_06415 [Parvularcula marina]